MPNSFDYASYLQLAAEKYQAITPWKSTSRTQPQQRFIMGNDPQHLLNLKRTDTVWTLIPYARLLREHPELEGQITVLRKYYKSGIVGAKIKGGPTIRSGAAKPVGVSIDEYIEAHNKVSDYLWHGWGIKFSSFSWASEQAFRLQLKKPLMVANPIGRRLLKPSRGICYPGRYSGPIEQWDIRGAYPYAMLANAHRFPVKLRPIHVKEWDKYESLILAHVQTTDRNKKTPIIQEHPSDIENPRQTTKWFWSFELATIINEGHRVVPLVAFKAITVDLSDELGAWHEIFSPRYTENWGFAGKLLKGMANTLWGSFMSSPMAEFWPKVDGQHIELDDWADSYFPGKTGGEHISAWVNASVSDRVYREFLSTHDVLYFDTDGGYCRPPNDNLLDKSKDEFGDWIYEGLLNELNVLGWQAYSKHSDDGISVKLSGVPNATMQDLEKWGTSRERDLQIQELKVDRTFNLVRGIGRNDNRITVMPPYLVNGIEHRFLQIDENIAPDISLFDVGDDDIREVSDDQAKAFRKVAEFDTEKTLDNGVGGDYCGGCS